MPEETIPPPVAAPDAAVLKAAEEVVTQSRAAVAASEQSRLELAAKVAALEAKLSAPAPAAPAPSPEVDELKRYLTRERNAAKIQAVRQMGLDSPLSDEDLLAIVPDVDPREPDGRAKLEQWRAARARLFRAPGPTPESVVEAVRVQAGDLAKKGGQLFSFDRLVASMFGGKQ